MNEQWDAIEAAILETRKELGKDVVYVVPPVGAGRRPSELLAQFLEDHGQNAELFLRTKLTHPDPLVAGYALCGLNKMDAPLEAAAAVMSQRTEKLVTKVGCFVWEGTLAQYARQLADEQAEFADD